MASIFDTIRQNWEKVKQGLQDNKGFVQKGSLTLQPVKQAIQNWAAQPQNYAVSSLPNKVLNTNFMPGQKMPISQAVTKVAQNYAPLMQQFGNVIRGTSDLNGNKPRLSVANVPVVGNMAQMAGNYAQTLGTGIGQYGKGIYQMGTGIANKSPMQVVKGAANTAYGIGNMYTVASPGSTAGKVFLGANVGSQLPLMNRIPYADIVPRVSRGVLQGQTGIQGLSPNVQERKQAEIFGVKFDPAMAAGSMFGFTKNPVNDKLFKFTNTWFPSKQVKPAMALLNTFIRGNIENISMNLEKLPDKPTDEEIVKFILQEGTFGGAAEILTQYGTEAVAKMFGPALRRFKGWMNQSVLVDAVDSQGNKIGKVRTTQLDKLIMDIKKTLRNEQGFIDPEAEIGGKPKPPQGGVKTYADIHNVNPDETITIYRGVRESQVGKLKGGEWVTQDKELAKLFMRDRSRAWNEDGRIITQKVKASELTVSPKTSPGVDNEFIYQPKSQPSTPQGGVDPSKYKKASDFIKANGITDMKSKEALKYADMWWENRDRAFNKYFPELAKKNVVGIESVYKNLIKEATYYDNFDDFKRSLHPEKYSQIGSGMARPETALRALYDDVSNKIGRLEGGRFMINPTTGTFIRPEVKRGIQDFAHQGDWMAYEKNIKNGVNVENFDNFVRGTIKDGKVNIYFDPDRALPNLTDAQRLSAIQKAAKQLMETQNLPPTTPIKIGLKSEVVEGKYLGEFSKAKTLGELLSQPSTPQGGVEATTPKNVDEFQSWLDAQEKLRKVNPTLPEEFLSSGEVAKELQRKQKLGELGKFVSDVESKIEKDMINPKVQQMVRELPDVRKKVNILDFFRTPKKVLQKIGLAKEADALEQGHYNYEKDLRTQMQKIYTWFKQVPDPKSAVNIFRYLDAGDSTQVQLNPAELKVAKEIQTYLKEWADKLKLPSDKRITHYITHIFEKGLIDKEFDPEVAKIIADKVPGSVYDPFLQKRLGAKGYVEDVWRALEAYTKRAVRKVNMDPALAKLEAASSKLDVDSWNYVKQLGDRINMRPTQIDNYIDNFIKSVVGYRFGQRPTTAITGNIRRAIYRGTLGLNIGSAMKNLTQGVNTYSELGERWTAKGYLDLIGKGKQGAQELVDNGILDDSVIQDRNLTATKQFLQRFDERLFTLFNAAERINRGSAYFGAKARALSRGMSEEEAIQAAREVVAKTQFKFSNIDTPLVLSSDIAKTLLQFQSFNLKQAEFLGEKLKNKDVAGLIRYALGTMLITSTVGKFFGYDIADAIPFSGIVTGETKIGQTPAVKLGMDLISAVTGGKGDYGQELTPEDRVRTIAGDAIPFIPAGVQGKKTIMGLDAVRKGYSENASGNIEYPVTQDFGTAVRAGMFGKYGLPQAKEYYANGGRALGPQQSARVKTFGADQYNKELGARYKDDALAAFFSGDKAKAKELQTKYKIKITKKELANYGRKVALEKYFAGDTAGAKKIQSSGVKITNKDMAEAAKKQAIKLYLSGDKAGARALQQKYKFKVTVKDLKGE